MNISLTQAIQDANAQCIYQEDALLVRLTGAASDNRLVKEGDIFICIKGNTVDGHSFAKDAMERGAKAILAEYNPFAEEFGDSPPIPVLLVEDSVKALGKLAHARRQAYKENKKHKVIAITGTAGKTSVKELIAHILSIEITENNSMCINENRVAKNPLNHNTQIGMPIAILNASGKEKFWVLELGISHAHDMEELGAILEPDLALILNVGSGHTEGLGEKGVAYHKASLLKYIQNEGIAFVSHDYPELVQEASHYKNIHYFSTIINTSKKQDNNNTIYATAKYLGINEQMHGQYQINLENTSFTVSSPFLGTSGAENCLAGACISNALDISKEIIVHACKNMPIPNRRFNRVTLHNWDIIDDCYNANPLSSARMVESAKELAKNKDFYALMGEMKELGKTAYDEHKKLGQILAIAGVKVLFWVGEQKEALLEGLYSKAFTGIFIPLVSPEDFISQLTNIQKNTVKHMTNLDTDKTHTGEKSQDEKSQIEYLILFKGSRSNHLENYVSSFKEYCHVL